MDLGLCVGLLFFLFFFNIFFSFVKFFGLILIVSVFFDFGNVIVNFLLILLSIIRVFDFLMNNVNGICLYFCGNFLRFFDVYFICVICLGNVVFWLFFVFKFVFEEMYCVFVINLWLGVRIF